MEMKIHCSRTKPPAQKMWPVKLTFASTLSHYAWRCSLCLEMGGVANSDGQFTFWPPYC